MIANLYAEESMESQMLSMVARCCPPLMRAGGGSLPREETHAAYVKLTPAQRTRILALGRKGKLGATAIARKIGPRVSTSAVYKLLLRNGISAPDGRAGRKVCAK